jgi:hypothetical protein
MDGGRSSIVRIILTSGERTERRAMAKGNPVKKRSKK